MTCSIGLNLDDRSLSKRSPSFRSSAAPAFWLGSGGRPCTLRPQAVRFEARLPDGRALVEFGSDLGLAPGDAFVANEALDCVAAGAWRAAARSASGASRAWLGCHAPRDGLMLLPWLLFCNASSVAGV